MALFPHFTFVDVVPSILARDRSGRTTQSLLAAISIALRGKEVIYISHTRNLSNLYSQRFQEMTERMVPVIRERILEIRGEPTFIVGHPDIAVGSVVFHTIPDNREGYLRDMFRGWPSAIAGSRNQEFYLIVDYHGTKVYQWIHHLLPSGEIGYLGFGLSDVKAS